ncbi:GNAT family N-acetyltransferase [Streptomyces sp. NPDC091416]|uniref:GNAT family N-acetyltransferase n=1 Tax=Streptomyces sp. NPDC091416 TaxID=3366003 RepID=UPI0037F35E23
MSEPTLHTAHTFRLAPAALDEIHAFLDTAFAGTFGEDDWDHTLGGVHACVRDASGLLAHGSVVQRRVIHAGRSRRVGYVEGVAVRADRRREGLGGQVMAALEEVVDGAYAFGALSASAAGAALYAGRGWTVWPGRIAVQGPRGAERLAEEEGSTYVRGVGGAALVPDGTPAAQVLVFDWRDGDVM